MSISTLGAISRRRFLRDVNRLGAVMAGGLLLPRTVRGSEAASQARAEAPSGSLIAYVGCFNTKERNERGEGISAYRIDPASGKWTRVQVVQDIVNPAFLIVDRTGRGLYSVNARIDQVSAFAIDSSSGALRFVNRQATGGVNPVHLVIDPSGRYLVVANYAAGNVAVLPIRIDGGLEPLTDLVTLPGAPGPHRVEQASSHPHHCPFDRSGRFVVVPDKGFDRVCVYRLDTARGRLVPAERPFVTTRSGAGPRHVDFHPTLPRAYVINELDSTVTTYRWGEDGSLEPMQIVPSIPSSFVGNNSGSEVVVSRSGRLVLASNRGHDSIGVFTVDGSSGLLSPLAWESTRGRTPRFICLSPSGRDLYAANQESDQIVGWRVDETTGRLTATTETIEVGTPTTIAFTVRA